MVEVTIAMGIVATVLIALLALLPYGMDNVREAKATLVQSRIANEIVGELQVAEWGRGPNYPKLAVFDGLIRKYDGDGTLIADTAERDSSNTIYKAKIELDVSEPSHLPGQALKTEGLYLRRVTVKVAYAPGDKEVDWQPQGNKKLPYRTFTTEIVKLARDEI